MKPRSVAISVEGFIGLPGAGKTYALAQRGLREIERGRRVYSNFDLRGSLPVGVWDHANIGNTKDPKDPCDCGECFVSISDAVILLDEINLWAPSRMWAALPIGLLHRWAQVRKYRTQILWSAQHEDRVDKVIREVTGWIWECRPFPGGRILHWVPGYPTFRLEAFEPSDLRRELSRKALQRANPKLRADIAEAYDTFRIVDMGSHTKRLGTAGNGAGRVAERALDAGGHDTRGSGVLDAPRGARVDGVHDLDGFGTLGDWASAETR